MGIAIYGVPDYDHFKDCGNDSCDCNHNKIEIYQSSYSTYTKFVKQLEIYDMTYEQNEIMSNNYTWWSPEECQLVITLFDHACLSVLLNDWKVIKFRDQLRETIKRGWTVAIC